MRPPAFWRDGGWPAVLLAPLGAVTEAVTARRVARPGWRAPVPVICCGNATVGGAGKTTLALDLGRRLRVLGRTPAFLTRGYGGGTTADAIEVMEGISGVGDEALLLAAVAPTFVAADRARAARAAVAKGADVLIMDDGLQNPTLVKTASFLVIDGAAGFGNSRLLPAGPLREPVAAAAARCRAAVLIGTDTTGVRTLLPDRLPVFAASLRSHHDPNDFTRRPLAAFAGIGRPEKFFETLAARGATLALRKSFPDHHPYTERDIITLLSDADRLGAVAVTTPKDFVRIPQRFASRIHAIAVDLVWDDTNALTALLADIVS